MMLHHANATLVRCFRCVFSRAPFSAEIWQHESSRSGEDSHSCHKRSRLLRKHELKEMGNNNPRVNKTLSFRVENERWKLKWGHKGLSFAEMRSQNPFLLNCERKLHVNAPRTEKSLSRCLKDFRFHCSAANFLCNTKVMKNAENHETIKSSTHYPGDKSRWEAGLCDSAEPILRTFLERSYFMLSGTRRGRLGAGLACFFLVMSAISFKAFDHLRLLTRRPYLMGASLEARRRNWVINLVADEDSNFSEIWDKSWWCHNFIH